MLPLVIRPSPERVACPQAYVKLKMAIVALCTKAAMVRPGALGKVRSRDPHFGKKSVHLHTPVEPAE